MASSLRADVLFGQLFFMHEVIFAKRTEKAFQRSQPWKLSSAGKGSVWTKGNARRNAENHAREQTKRRKTTELQPRWEESLDQ